jgi:hypothetical protein
MFKGITDARSLPDHRTLKEVDMARAGGSETVGARAALLVRQRLLFVFMFFGDSAIRAVKRRGDIAGKTKS